MITGSESVECLDLSLQAGFVSSNSSRLVQPESNEVESDMNQRSTVYERTSTTLNLTRHLSAGPNSGRGKP